MSATNDKTWNQWEAELAETFRKWWPAAGAHEVLTTWKQDAAGKRRALRATNDLAERRVTLTFEWRSPTTHDLKVMRITAEKRERAIENLAALARACEWLRMAEVREIHSIITILLRQMHPPASSGGGAQGGGNQQQQRQEQRQQQQQTPPLSSGPYAVLHVTNDAPLAIAEAAYRAAARDFHAQANHGTEALRIMQALNAAIAAIRLERKDEYAQRR